VPVGLGDNRHVVLLDQSSADGLVLDYSSRA